MDPITAISLGSKALGVAKRFWYFIPMAGLLTVAQCRGDKIEDLQGDLKDAGNALAVAEQETRALETQLDDISNRIKKSNEDAIAEQAKRIELAKRVASERAKLDERYTSTKRTVEALEASAAQVPADECAPSAAALKALEDL
jgi:septal ring factor EnvC (AmiA/AmiB activator)